MIKQEIEAILLLSGDDMKIIELCKYFKLSEVDAISTLREIRREYRDRGINLEIKEDRVFFTTNPKCGETVHNFYNQEGKPKKLSNAAMETLSIIAYRQPITRSELEAIRGVAVDGVMHNLEEKKLVEIVGKKEGVGRPNLYGVTDVFLAYMGISALEELPNYYEVQELMRTEKQENKESEN